MIPSSDVSENLNTNKAGFPNLGFADTSQCQTPNTVYYIEEVRSDHCLSPKGPRLTKFEKGCSKW